MRFKMRFVSFSICLFFMTTVLALDEDRLVKLGFPRSGTKKLSSLIAKRILKHVPNHVYDRYVHVPKYFEPQGNCDNGTDINKYFMDVYANDSQILDERSFERIVKFQIRRGKREDLIENKAQFFKCKHDNKVILFKKVNYCLTDSALKIIFYKLVFPIQRNFENIGCE